MVRAPRHCPERLIEQFVADHQAWLEKQLAAFRPQKAYPPEEIEALRAKAMAALPGRVAFFAPRMGVAPKSLKITGARCRYGSCSTKGGICFSLFLMERSGREIDYVVVHELAHLKQHNHGPAFYREIERILPDYRERIKELKV